MSSLRNLLEELRRGERPHLSVEEVESLLSWLTGSAARDDAEPAGLSKPGHDPVLLQMVLYRLDDILFESGELRPVAAGLDSSEPVTRRRIRFRRLASAFHPDRFPELDDWLTQRSQAVHRAYARFKRDPDAVIAPPQQSGTSPSSQYPGSRRQDIKRARPRVRKHRFRAFANQLRARFGNDRYLAHKLIGGLAVLALLPVLNMVLVPANDAVDGSRFAVDGGDDAKTVSGVRVPVSGERRDGGAAVDSGEMFVDADSGRDDAVGAVSGRDRSAPETPPTKRDSSAPETPPTKRDSSAQDAPPTTSEPDSQSLTRQAPTSEEGAGVDETPQTSSEPSTGVGAGLAGDDRNPGSRIAATPGEITDSNDPARKASTVNREPVPRATDPEITPLFAAARHAMNPNGKIAAEATLQTVDEQLAAMGLENDTERLYRRIGREESVDGGREEKPVSGFRVPVSGERREGATEGSGEESAGVDSSGDESAQDAPPTASRTADQPTDPAPSKDVEADPAGADLAADAGEDSVGAASSRDDGVPEPRTAAAPIEAAETGRPARKPETGNPKPAPSAQDAPPTASRTADQATSQANRPTGRQATDSAAGPGHHQSELALGPLATHPAGQVLARLHEALGAGNIPGIAGSFASDAQMDSLSGRDEIAEHFRANLSPADSRRIILKVVRLGRDNDGWRIETDLDVRVEHDGNTRNLVKDRNIFWLAERGEQLLITRMEYE